jgi:hypothetical protein
MRSLVCLLSVLLLSASSDAFAATLCVNPGGSGGCFATVQAAVDAAARNDVIEMAAGTYVGQVQMPEGKPLTLHGAGAGATIIDGNTVGNAALRFDGRNPGASTIDGVTLRNGGSGLMINGVATVALANSAVSGNGVGISTAGGRLILTVTNCSITGNGGGMNLNSAGKAKITASLISGNSSGGGIASGVRLTIVDSTISNNTSQDDGGGIHSLYGTLTVMGSTISGNTSTGDGHSSVGNGGGIDAGPISKIVIENSTISGNSAVNGGGVEVGVNRAATLDHVTIADNVATSQGGGLHSYPFSPAKPITLSASLLAGNSAADAPDCSAPRVVAKSGDLVEDPTGCTITTTAHSFVLSQDPLLGPLQNNGGGTDTQALGGGSPAIGVVTAATECRTPDQRGVPRAVPCDLGAYEAP